jgi:acetylornithine deacetylase/succinyl-diaminopimelate desuccinylase-like protein
MGRHLCAVLACGALALTGASASAQSDAQIAKSAQANFAEFFDMLALPNDAIVPVDIQRNANWLEVAFKKRGFTTQQLPNNGRPLVFAQYPRKVADAKTILFYMHFDGQPVIPSQWSQKSPWTATLRQRVGAKWEEIDAKRLQDGVIDPEWRIFARSSSDDKARS